MGKLQGPEDLTADYRYFIAPVVPDSAGKVTKIIEIPFQDVSWGRALKEAGSFTGTIPVIEDTFNLALYENTMPGKNAIYVVRNGVCVWGGIIWSRSYNANDKNLEVSGSEFTSYFYHRAAWKTWSNNFQASVEIVSNVGTVTLSSNDFTFTVGMAVFIDFGNESNLQHSGYYSVATVVNARSFTFSAPDVSDLIEQELTTVQVRTNTYDYARGLLEELKVDFFGTDFPNFEIEPAQQFFQRIVSISRTNNVGTATQDASYVLVPGQKITLSDVSIAGFNGKFTVISTPTNSSFTFASAGNNVANTNLSSNVKNITTLERQFSVALIQTSVAHGFSKESIVTVSGLGGGFDGRHIITDVPSSTTFTYNSFGDEVALSPIESATATVIPAVKFSTFGEFPANAGIGINYSTDGPSASPPISNETIRGYELGIVGEILENYSDIKGGFEYRIDCSYDNATDSFYRTFVFLPLIPDAVVAYGELASGQIYPVSVFGADKLVFEFPGNVTGLTLDENAEDASTRFWVRGNLEYLSEDASQPYAAASALDLLNYGWPILDQIEDQKDVGDEAKLYSFAERYLEQTRPPIGNVSISVNGSLKPEVGTYKPGDYCSIIIDDDFIKLRLESELELEGKRDVLVRKIDAFSVSVPNSPTFPEIVSLELVFESGVDKVG